MKITPGPDGVPLIQGRYGLNALQVATSDGKGHTESASVVFFLQSGESTKTGIKIVLIDHDPPGTDVLRERVVIRSESSEPVDLTGWTLRDLSRHVFRFPSTKLQPGQSVSVWTGDGRTDERNLYWGRRAGVWTNTGDTAVLSDLHGREIHRVAYSRQRRRA